MSSMEGLSLYQVGQSKDRSGRALVLSVVCFVFASFAVCVQIWLILNLIPKYFFVSNEAQPVRDALLRTAVLPNWKPLSKQELRS